MNKINSLIKNHLDYLYSKIIKVKNYLPKQTKKFSWRIAGCSVIGTSHINSGDICHDSLEYKVFDDGTLIIAVSDGAGSVRKPKEGSSFVADNITKIAEERLIKYGIPYYEENWRSFITDCFKGTINSLIDLSEKEKEAISNYAATCILVVVTEKWAVCGLIGDCAAVVLNSDDKLYSMCSPQKGEYANMTYFLTQHNAIEALSIFIKKERVKSLAVFSDGLLELSLNVAKNIPHRPFFDPLFSFVADIEDDKQAEDELASFLHSERVNARTNDDKTLILASRIIA